MSEFVILMTSRHWTQQYEWNAHYYRFLTVTETVEDVESATLGWVHQHNTGRLLGYLGDTPPQSSKPRSTMPTERLTLVEIQ